MVGATTIALDIIAGVTLQERLLFRRKLLARGQALSNSAARPSLTSLDFGIDRRTGRFRVAGMIRKRRREGFVLFKLS
jgi:hypothetical protein